MTQPTYDQAYFTAQLKTAITPEEVRGIYLKLSKAVHPDLHPELGQEPMKALNNAYEAVMQSWDGKNYRAAGYRDGKPVEDKEYTYTWEGDFERLAMDIINYACTHPYMQSIELIGSWLWVGGQKGDPNCPFTAPEAEKNDEGKWIPTEEDKRPYWESLDGTGTMLKFEFARGEKLWYFDLRRLVTRNLDKKRRGGSGLAKARNKYGSKKFSKREETSMARTR